METTLNVFEQNKLTQIDKKKNMAANLERNNIFKESRQTFGEEDSAQNVRYNLGQAFVLVRTWGLVEFILG